MITFISEFLAVRFAVLEPELAPSTIVMPLNRGVRLRSWFVYLDFLLWLWLLWLCLSPWNLWPACVKLLCLCLVLIVKVFLIFSWDPFSFEPLLCLWVCLKPWDLLRELHTLSYLLWCLCFLEGLLILWAIWSYESTFDDILWIFNSAASITFVFEMCLI